MTSGYRQLQDFSDDHHGWIRDESPDGDTALFGGAVRAYGWRVRATLTSGTTWVFMWIPYEAGEPAWFLGKYVAEDLSEATCSGMTAQSDARMASGEGLPVRQTYSLRPAAASRGRLRRCEFDRFLCSGALNSR